MSFLLTNGRMKRKRSRSPVRYFAVMIFAAGAFPSAAFAQAQESGEEIVANLAAGRLMIAVAKDGIVIAALENAVEPATHPPMIVELGSHRAGVLLGAADWRLPDSGEELARLDRELPRLHSSTAADTPHLQQGEGGPATDIEQIGLGVYERLRDVMQHIHGKLDLGPDEPLVELILADYVPGYGPEVWRLDYPITQEPLRGDFWQTRALRPRYTQLWPPEKGQPRTLIEAHYPLDDATPGLLDLLQQNDSRLAHLRASDSKMAEVADLLTHGGSQKATAADTLQFLRAALTAIAAPREAQVVAVIGEQTGFEWVVAPPAEKEKKLRPPGAPTLRKPTQ